jgi:hypothetical protein
MQSVHTSAQASHDVIKESTLRNRRDLSFPCRGSRYSREGIEARGWPMFGIYHNTVSLLCPHILADAKFFRIGNSILSRRLYCKVQIRKLVIHFPRVNKVTGTSKAAVC